MGTINLLVTSLRTDTKAHLLSSSRMESTAQLSLCRRMLSETKSSGEGRQLLTQAQRTWLELVKKEEAEQEHIHELANGVFEEFIKAPIKDSTSIAEILLIAPTLDEEHYRKLLNDIIKAFGEATLQDTYLLQGLIQLVQSASDGYLHEDDFVRVLKVLREQLQDTHLQSSEHPFHLTVAVSRVLDVMAECKVEDLDRVSHREPLLEVLKAVQESNDPYLLYQASYAFQALQYVTDEESALQTVLRHTGTVAEGLVKVSGVVKLDMGNLFDGLKQLQKTMNDTYDAVKSGFEGVRSLVQGGRGLFESLKQGLGSGFKRPWYPALRAADDLVRNGRLYDLKSLILEAPCRHEPEFQWGISQLLGEIARDRSWSNPERQQAATFLIYLLECGKKWTKDESVRLWMLTILRHLKTLPGGIIMGEARVRLDDLLTTKDDVLYDSFPLVDTLPTSTSSPLLDRIQPTAAVEYGLSKLKHTRVEEYRGTTYISPNAKGNLLQKDKASFPLMPKVNLFLHSKQHVFLLLGDSGAGKSAFNRHLECELWGRYKKGGRIPLHINLPAIPQPDYDLIAKQLSALDFSQDQIMEMKQNREFVVICDGYDESQLQGNLYRSNQFNRSFQWKVKMLISCRSTYLNQDYRGRFEPLSTDKYTTPLSAYFQEAVIVPFSSAQIKEYIGKFVHFKDTPKLFNGQQVWDVEEYMMKLESIPNMMELVKNPFLLLLSLRTLPLVYQEIPDVTTVTATRLMLYDRFIEQWIQVSQRRIQDVIHVYPPDQQFEFEELVNEGFPEAVMSYAKKLAAYIVTMHDNNPIVEYRSPRDRGTWKESFFGRDARTTILREACPMTRAGNQHRFLHRSLVEYFCALSITNPEPDIPFSEPVTITKPFQPAFSDNTANNVVDDSEDRSIVKPEVLPPARTSTPLDTSSPPRTASSIIEPNPISISSFVRTPSPVDTLAEVNTSSSAETSFVGSLPTPDGTPSPSLLMTQPPVRGPSAVRDPAPSKPISLPLQSLPLEMAPPPAPVSTPLPRPVRKSSLSLPNPLRGKILVKDQSTLQFLAERVQQNEALKLQFYAAIERSKKDPSAAVDAANAITALVRAGERFNGSDLSGARIPGADVSGGDFDSVQLIGADLNGATLTRAWFRHANFFGAKMKDVKFGEWPYLQMKAEVNTCAYSPNGLLLAIGFSGGAISLISTESWLRVRDLVGHNWTVTHLSFSPDNEQLVSASEDKLVKLWNVMTGCLEKTIEDQSETIACVVYSPDGDCIAAASHDATVRVYNRSSLDVELELKGHTGAVKSVTYSPSGDLMATASYDWTVRIWNPKTGHQKYVMRGHTAWVTSVSISPNNSLVASSGQDMTVRMWNGANGMALYILKGHTAFVKNVSFSPSGHQLASGSGDHTVRLWDGVTGTPGPVLSGHTQSVVTLSYSPHKAQIATGSWDSTVRLWDTSASALLSEQNPSAGSVENVSQSVPSNDFNRTLSGGHSSSSSLDMGPAFATAIGINLSDHTFSFSSVACSSDGQLVATCSIDQVRLYNANTGAFNVSLRGHNNSVTSLAFSYDSTLLVTGSYDKTARIWNVQTGEGGHVLGGHTEAVTAVAFSPTGAHIATGSDDRLVKVWSTRTGSVYCILPGHTEVIKSLVFSPNRQQIHLASGGGDNNIKLWHARDALFDRDLIGHSNAVESVSFTSDGKRLASGSRDGTARIWDVSSGQSTHELTGPTAHKNAVTALAFSPNNLRLATGSWDKSVKIWDVQSGKCLVTVEELVGEVNSIAWKPLLPEDNGSMYFVTGCADKSVRMWKLIEPANGPHSVQLHWRSAFDGLMVKGANVDRVFGLSRNNESLLKQRGTTGEPRWY
ncbi:hypothetical protein BGZ96_007692 [Linnemannia gamsii]|uniref:Arm-like repeat domain-containing protein n=1 Tax=Linnemannia gamsii TaxID=64522 RepID=A0ABQ7JZW6_9FUNG|nr:hypothetical protein BGZ96_007692 [Linnemannia gamsii]